MDDAERDRLRRIRRARQTRAVIEQLRSEPSAENEAAFHRLHAQHLRERGDLEGAAQAEARATYAEAASGAPSSATSLEG